MRTARRLPALLALATSSLALASAAALGFIAAPASADAPTPKSKTIVAVSSIGGIKLGTSYKDAIANWGTGSQCSEEDQKHRDANGGAELDRSKFLGACTWRTGEGEATSTSGTAGLLFNDGKVVEVSLRCAQNPKSFAPTSAGPIGKYKLKQGKTKLGCGSPIAKIKKAKGTPSGVALYQKDRMLSFGSSGGRISGIALLLAKNY